MLFDLDSNPIKEVGAIENIEMMQDPDALVNTGFIMSSSTNDTWEDEPFLRRDQIFTNEYVNLLF